MACEFCIVAKGRRGSSAGCFRSFVFLRGEGGVRALGSLRDQHFDEGKTGSSLKLQSFFERAEGKTGFEYHFGCGNWFISLSKQVLTYVFRGPAGGRQNQLVSLGSKMVQEIVEAAAAHEGSVR